MTFESLITDEQFREKLNQAKDMAEVKALFSGEGVEISEEELMNKILPAEQELSEESLENVSGGGAIMNWFRKWLAIGKSPFSGGGGSAGGR